MTHRKYSGQIHVALPRYENNATHILVRKIISKQNVVMLDTCWLLIKINLLNDPFMLQKNNNRDARTRLKCNFVEIGKHIWGNVPFKFNGDVGHVVTLTGLFIHSPKQDKGSGLPALNRLSLTSESIDQSLPSPNPSCQPAMLGNV